MGTSKIALNAPERAISEAVRTHWIMFLVQGIIMVVLGVLAIIWPQISTLAVDLYVGWMFLLSGLTGLHVRRVERGGIPVVSTYGRALLIRGRTSALAPS